MKKEQIIFLVICSILLMCQSSWSQNLIEVDGKLSINQTDRINVHDNFIANVKDPTLPQDAATKVYVDNLLISFGISLGQPGIQGLLDAGYSPAELINAGVPTSDFIGLNHEGGIIFYMETNGTGLVAAPTDQIFAEWGCTFLIPGADGTAIGTGSQNTIDMLAGCTDLGTAAEISGNLNLNGFTDWFLPSKDELNEMYIGIGQGASGSNQNIGGFGALPYWSSSEFNDFGAWGQLFANGVQSDYDKEDGSWVRAIRAFN